LRPLPRRTRAAEETGDGEPRTTQQPRSRGRRRSQRASQSNLQVARTTPVPGRRKSREGKKRRLLRLSDRDRRRNERGDKKKKGDNRKKRDSKKRSEEGTRKISSDRRRNEQSEREWRQRRRPA
jgi:hypothetical protein